MKKVCCWVMFLVMVSIGSFSGVFAYASAPQSQIQPQVAVTYSYSGDETTTYPDNAVLRGGSLPYADQETIKYANKTEEEFFIKNGLPSYSYSSTSDFTCAVQAGGHIIGFFDKDYDQVIANFSAGRTIRDQFIWSKKNSIVDAALDELYVRMETNVHGNGTTAPGFRNGLQSYMSVRGYNTTYNTVVNSGYINDSLYRQELSLGKPVVLFLSAYNFLPISSFTQDSNTDLLNYNIYSGNHIVVAYGYKTVSYFDAANNLIKRYSFVRVASGFVNSPFVYLKLNDRTNIDEGQSISLS